MSSDMSLRDLYLPADTTVDLAAAKAKASDLCRHATVEDLRILIDDDWITGATAGGTDVSDLTDDGVLEHTERLRHLADAYLHLLLEAFAASLQHRDVAPLPLRPHPRHRHCNRTCDRPGHRRCRRLRHRRR